jgi:phosphoribosylformimino-5-aminoimidazole carboxamide ribotide isomerase
MQIIPVLDLKGGVVVHAKQGQRDAYRPIVSPLSPTSEPTDVLAGLLRLHAFQTIYIADLDAIERKGEHVAAITQLAHAHPHIEFWIDDGRTAPPPRRAYANVHYVLGSESLRDVTAQGLAPGDPHAILSLDFRGADFVGPPELLEQPALWPQRVIVMTLARVGSAAGPDLDRLASVKGRAGARDVFAAGGVRHRADLDALRSAGAAGVLVASALHDDRLVAADLAEFS